MKLSLVIPCYNEAKNLPFLVERLNLLFTRPDVEVIIVDNGSTDASPEVLKELLTESSCIRSVRVPVNRGYGFGILEGLICAGGDYIGWTHADLQTDPGDAIRALEIIENRQCPGRVYLKGRRYGRPLADLFFTAGMSVFETFYLRRWLWDINAQPNIFHRSFFASWLNPPHDFSLDLFAYYEARRQQIEVVRFPVRFAPRLHGVSSWNVDWESKLRFIKRTLAFSCQLKASLRSAV